MVDPDAAEDDEVCVLLLQHAAYSAVIVYLHCHQHHRQNTSFSVGLLDTAAPVMSRPPDILHHLNSQPVLVHHALACVL